MTVRYFTKICQNTVLYARTVVQASDPSLVSPTVRRPSNISESMQQGQATLYQVPSGMYHVQIMYNVHNTQLLLESK